MLEESVFSADKRKAVSSLQPGVPLWFRFPVRSRYILEVFHWQYEERRTRNHLTWCIIKRTFMLTWFQNGFLWFCRFVVWKSNVILLWFRRQLFKTLSPTNKKPTTDVGLMSVLKGKQEHRGRLSLAGALERTMECKTQTDSRRQTRYRSGTNVYPSVWPIIFTDLLA